MPKASITTVPAEILDIILSEVKVGRDLLNVGLTCKFVFHRAFLRLYENVHLCRGKNLFDPARTVLPLLASKSTESITAKSIPNIGSLVKTLTIGDNSVHYTKYRQYTQYHDTKFRMRWVGDVEDKDVYLARIKEIEGDNNEQRGWEIPEEVRDGYIETFNKALRDALTETPNLRSFSLKKMCEFENKTMKALTEMKTLTEVEIKFPGYMCRYRNGDYFYTHGTENGQFVYHSDFWHVSVAGFRNLTSFKVYNLYGDISRYIKDIAEVLIENRNTLREIGFSVSKGTQRILIENDMQNEDHGQHHDETEVGWENGVDEYYKEVWHKVCCRYVRKAIRLPGACEDKYDKLQIESLHLGEWIGMFPEPHCEPRGKDTIAMALDLKCLRKLNWHNFRTNNWLEYDGHEEAGNYNRDWPRLLPCDNLVDIEVLYAIGDMFFDFIKQRGPNAKPIERFVAYDYEEYEGWMEPDFLTWVLTDALKELYLMLPKYKMADLKAAPNLEDVFISTQEVWEHCEPDGSVFEEEDGQPEGEGNPLRHFLPLTKLRSMGFVEAHPDAETEDFDREFKEIDGQLEERHAYIVAMLNEGHWKDLRYVRVVKWEEDLTRFEVVRASDGTVTLVKEQER